MGDQEMGERIARLEQISENTVAQLEGYMRDHKDTHKEDREKMRAIEDANAAIIAKLNNRGSFYMMVATLIAALFAGFSPIAVSLINAGIKP